MHLNKYHPLGRKKLGGNPKSSSDPPVIATVFAGRSVSGQAKFNAHRKGDPVNVTGRGRRGKCEDQRQCVDVLRRPTEHDLGSSATGRGDPNAPLDAPVSSQSETGAATTTQGQQSIAVPSTARSRGSSKAPLRLAVQRVGRVQPVTTCRAVWRPGMTNPHDENPVAACMRQYLE